MIFFGMSDWHFLQLAHFPLRLIHYPVIRRRMKDEMRGQTCIRRDSITNFVVVIIIGIPKVIIFRAGNVGGGCGKDGDNGSVQPVTS